MSHKKTQRKNNNNNNNNNKNSNNNKNRFVVLTLEELIKRFYDKKNKKFNPIPIYITQTNNPNKYPPEYEDYNIELKLWRQNPKKGIKPIKPKLLKNPEEFFDTMFIPDGDLSIYNPKTKEIKKLSNWLSKYANNKSMEKEILDDNSNHSFFLDGKIKWDSTQSFSEDEGLSICKYIDEYPKKKLFLSNNCHTQDLCFVFNDKYRQNNSNNNNNLSITKTRKLSLKKKIKLVTGYQKRFTRLTLDKLVESYQAQTPIKMFITKTSMPNSDTNLLLKPSKHLFDTVFIPNGNLEYYDTEKKKPVKIKNGLQKYLQKEKAILDLFDQNKVIIFGKIKDIKEKTYQNDSLSTCQIRKIFINDPNELVVFTNCLKGDKMYCYIESS